MTLPRRPGLWAAAFLVWAGTLWWLSSRVHDFPQALDFRASDKLFHFGWFFGGAGLFAAALYLAKPQMPARTRILVTTVVLTLFGVLDEFHQSFIPGRSGNDPGDMLADFLGALAGALVFNRLKFLFISPDNR